MHNIYPRSLSTRQRGLGLISWLVLLSVVAVAGSLAMRIAPLYWHYTQVVSVAESLQSDRTVADASRTEAWRLIDRSLRDQGLQHLGPRIFKLEGSGQDFVVIIDYEERAPFIANLDVVARFERRIGPE